MTSTRIFPGRLMCAAISLLVLAVQPVRAETAAGDWKPTLSKPSSGVYGPTDTIHFTLPPLPAETIQHLALELDAMDVTNLVSMQGNQVSVTPPQALAWGQHQLRLIEYAESGDIIERGAWTLDVRKSTSFREAALQSNVTVNGSYRVSDRNLTNPPDQFQSDGAMQIQGAVADDNWKLAAKLDVHHGNQVKPPSTMQSSVFPAPTQPPAQPPRDSATYLVTAATGPLTVNAGNQVVTPDSLIMQGFSRRGVSASVSAPDNVGSVTGFALHSQNIIGFEQGLGVSDPNNRVDGVTAVIRPISGNSNALSIAGTYLKGEGPSQVGVASNGDTSPNLGGNAAAVSADANLAAQHVRVRGEYAVSKFDFDGIGAGDPAQDDHAYTALVQYSPLAGTPVSGQPMAVNVGVENRRIGTFFRSPANPMGIADREGVRGFASLMWYGVNAQASVEQLYDNVNNISLMPRTGLNQANVMLAYTPLLLPGTDGQLPAPPWYGQPTFTLGFNNVDRSVDRAAGGLSSGPLQSMTNMQAGATFSYATWNWMLMHMRGDNLNYQVTGTDTENRQTQLAANIRLGTQFTIGPSAQYGQVLNKSNSALDTDTQMLGLNLGYLFTPQLNTGFTYSVGHQQTADGSSDAITRDLTGNIGWMAWKAHGMQPGVTFTLSGSRHVLDDRAITSNNLAIDQIFLRMTVAWQPSY